MKKIGVIILAVYAAGFFHSNGVFCETELPLKVVTTLPDYAVFAREIGKERVSVTSLVRGDQDAHFIRPKPSFVTQVRDADVLISTGLDLELWLPTVINASANTHVRSGNPGYVSAARGMRLLEKPKIVSRIEGGLHIYGNPHVTCSPVNMKTAAGNIAYGLIKNDPDGKEFYLENVERLLDEIDKKLYGERLVEIIGGETLCGLAEKGKLMSFLQEHFFEGEPLLDHLGGWMKEMLPLRGVPVVTYHKNWIYFLRLFGLEEAGTIEPKPGIPPSARHTRELERLMKEKGVHLILSANYFDERRVEKIAGKTGAEAVVVPLYVGGTPGTDDYFKLVDHWIGKFLEAGANSGIIEGR
ncbi:MAG: hypothetical protein DRP85_05870 [Candidatus Makaraimicrobium thalassicum]|nr:MAG: hypothetical protein DRP85_05870 [Candidatus Omnitrophota bacterium]